MNKNKIRMRRLFFFFVGLALWMQMDAQPARRRVKTSESRLLPWQKIQVMRKSPMVMAD